MTESHKKELAALAGNWLDQVERQEQAKRSIDRETRARDAAIRQAEDLETRIKKTAKAAEENESDWDGEPFVVQTKSGSLVQVTAKAVSQLRNLIVQKACTW